MIVKMKFLQISGPETDIDRMCNQYLAKHEMQLENAIAELKTTDTLLPFVEVNPYRASLARAEQFCGLLEGDKPAPDLSMDKESMMSTLWDIQHEYVEMQEKREILKKQSDDTKESANALEPFRTMNVDLGKVGDYRFLQMRFGRLGLEQYRRLDKYLFQDLKAVFIEGSRNENYVYGGYITANRDKGEVDAVFNSLRFERISLGGNFKGTPEEAWQELKKKQDYMKQQIEELDEKMMKLMNSHAAMLLGAKEQLQELADYFDIRKKAAKISGNEEKSGRYILCGWMGEDDVAKFLQETKDDPNVMVLVEENREKFFGEPPTKLKNPRFFKPFEMFIEMYGLPAADEMDPTMFVALTYTFIFGAMFGDLGQGAVLFAAGGLLYLTKKMNLAGIISIAGLFSMFFGLMFGSVFGFEDVIPALWLKRP